MSLGYIKGKFWHPDEHYARYSSSDSYKELLRSMRPANFTFNCEYSYTARRYTAEIITVEKFANSGQYYIVKHNNAYHENPMAAVCVAIRANDRCTPWVRAACLVIECELLAEAVAAARKRERLRDKIDTALDELATVLAMLPLDYDCENCIGMAEHGCYCKAMGAPRPGVAPFSHDEDDDL